MILASLSLTGWALALLCAFCATFALIGRRFEPLDLFSHFAPLYAAGCILALSISASPGVSHRLALVLLASAGLVICGLLLGPEILRGSTRPSERAAPRLTIVQFNVWGGNRTPEKATDWILRQAPDVVILQESGPIRSALAQRGGYHVICGDCESVILSKSSPVWHGSASPLTSHRGTMAGATFQDAFGDYSIVGVHASWPTRRRRLHAEFAALQSLLAPLPRPGLIVAGDFNLTPWSSALGRLDRMIGAERRTRGLFSWPANGLSHYGGPAPIPFLPIDHVYAGSDWATVSVKRGPRLGSDHYPIVVVLARKQI